MKRALIALLAGVAVFGSVFAFAAALGVNSDNLGAGDDTVAACQPDGVGAVDVSYTVSWDDDGFNVDEVHLDGGAACAEQDVQIALLDGSTTLAEGEGTLDSEGKADIAPDADVNAADLDSIHVVATGEAN